MPVLTRTKSSSRGIAGELDEFFGRSQPRVLVAVDQFDESATAVHLAVARAFESGARIFVVHVLERMFYGRCSYDLESPAEAWALVDDAVSAIRRMDIEASGHVARALVGQAADAIIAEAAKVGAAEIVIGCVRHRTLLGRRTRERLLRRSPIPVLVAPRLVRPPSSSPGLEAARRRRAA